MKRTALILWSMLIIASISSAQSKLEQNFQKMSDEILENLQSFYPVLSTERGIHEYDYAFTDYSENSIKKEISKLKKFEVRIHKYQNSSLSEASNINLSLLKSNVDIALQDLERIKWHEINPYMYIDDAVRGIYLILLSEYSTLEIRTRNIISRWKGVPDLFTQAKKNLKDPPPVYIRLADEYVITGTDFYREVEAELSAKFPELADEIHNAAQAAVDAMLEFQSFLRIITPGESGSFAIGKYNFDYRLEYEYFLDYDSDSLLKLGEQLLAETGRIYDEYMAMLDTIGNQIDSVFVIDCITKEDILKYYNWEVEQAKLFLMEHDLVSIPEDIGNVEVTETPAFLANVISGYAYQQPGVFSPVQKGYFYVRSLAENMDEGQRAAKYKYIQRRGFKGLAIHESYPGHHLQFQMASRLQDDVRKWQENALLYEGWALYCEEMMYEQGYYGNDQRRYLNILEGIRFRAARIIADVKLHTGQMTRDEAVAWMAEAISSDTGWVGTEIDRYTLTPTIQMSYLTGKLEILRLRDAIKRQQGDDFSLKDFHDRLLAEGSLPPAVIREIWGL